MILGDDIPNRLTTVDRVVLVAVAVSAITRTCVGKRLLRSPIRENVILNSSPLQEVIKLQY